MYLKNLSLRGFKTFADKTVIEFNPPGSITAIVGPNGCGKSNLVDAIRWVLGEQNPKELRSSALEDVIFAGSAARKPLSLAEVSIEMDNTDNKIKTEFSEIGIKRRTFRSGDSEFFINKSNCRLKDIRDLFLDTGLGAGSYSIISQGQVDAILSSKPEERRAIFEEAAKINKYKFRKTAAERKLISTEQNMLRIADLKSEISNQLGNLEEQARKAAEFMGLKEKLKVLEVGLAKRQIKSLNEKKNALNEKIDGLKSQMELGLNLTRQNEERRAAKKEELRSVNFEIESARLNMGQAKLSYEENKSLILLEKEKKRNLEERIAEAESQFSELSAKLDLLVKRKKELEGELASISGSRTALEATLLENERSLTELEGSIRELEEHINEIKSLILEKESSLSAHRNEKIELESNMRLATEETKHDDALITKLVSERNDLVKRTNDLKIELDRFDVTLNNKNEAVGGLPEMHEDLNVRFAKGYGIAEALGSDVNVNLEIAYGDDVKVNKVTMNDQVILSDGVLSGGTLRERVKNILRKEREIAVLIEQAKSKHDLEASSLEIGNINDELDLIKKSLGAREREIRDINSRIYGISHDINTLEKELSELNNTLVTSGEKMKKAALDREALSIKLTETKVNYATVSSKADGLDQDLEKCSGEISSINETISSRNRTEMKQRLEETIKGIFQLEQSLPKLVDEEKQLAVKLEASQAKRTIVEKEIDELEKMLSGETNQDRTIRDALSKEEISLTKLDGELTSVGERMMNEYGMSLDQIIASELDVPLNRSREEAESLKGSIAALGPVNLLATEEFEKARERFSFIESQYNDLVVARENLSSLIKELDEKARKDFIDTLKIINKNFSDIFATLFEDGEAKLIMPEGVDILEGGIEIMARPGGKRWLNLSAMSGGERALTAIALLFALLRTHPSPFCLMDEADAALDEANIHRYAKLLRDFSRTTQVVLITHNKQTMEIADTMYGVTMEEPGVSKIISVKLAKAA